MPVLQCLQLKELDSKGGDSNTAQRFRIVLSDVRNYVQCMLATQANHVVHDGKLVRGSIVRMKQYQAQVVKGKKCVGCLGWLCASTLTQHTSSVS